MVAVEKFSMYHSKEKTTRKGLLENKNKKMKYKIYEYTASGTTLQQIDETILYMISE